MKEKKLITLKRVTTKILILCMLFQFILPIVSFVKADEIPENVRVITDKNEKEQLLGITSEDARTKNPLGLAQEFSLFTKENVVFTNADSEGRIAAGGSITATTSYAYQAGTEINDIGLANIIAGKGIRNLELSYTNHNALGNQNYNDNMKRIAAIGSNATEMDWDSFNEENQKQIVVTDLIDFNEEFTWLQNKSNELSNLTSNGRTVYGYLYGGQYNRERHQAKILRGHSDVNVFNLTVGEFNRLCNYNEFAQGDKFANCNLILDIPLDSKVIINVVGEGEVNFNNVQYNINHALETMPISIFTPASEEYIVNNPLENNSSINNIGSNYCYAYCENDFVRDENGNMKLFKVQSNSERKNTFYSDFYKNIIYNFPNANSVKLGTNMHGTILAPNADVSGNYGFLYGSLISKSFTGGTQFRTDRMYKIRIIKVFNGVAPTEDAELRILDEDGNVVIKWNPSSIVPKEILLKEGIYTLEESRVPSNYEQPVLTKMKFRIESAEAPLYYKIVMNEEKSQLVEKSYSLGGGEEAKEKIRTAQNLYNAIPNIGNHDVRKLKFTINSPITQELFYIVASNGYGLTGDVFGFDWIAHTDWVEFKNWTSVNDGIDAIIYAKNKLYDNIGGYAENTVPNPGTKIHFYVKDENSPTGAREVTDEVEVTDIKAVWYEEEKTTQEFETMDDYRLLDNKSIIFINNSIKPTIEIVKKDAETKDIIQNAKFVMKSEDGKVEYIPRTENGKIIFGPIYGLIPGKYYIEEQEAPTGYVISKERKEVVIDPNESKTYTIEATNKKIKIIKKDEYENNLLGAVYRVTDSNGNVIDEFTTDSSTEYALKGFEKDTSDTYTLHEVQAPKGYERSEDIVFTISESGEAIVNNNATSKITVQDKYLRGTINITKNGEILNNVETVKKDDSLITYLFSWKNGLLSMAEFELYAKNDIILNGTKIYSKDERIGVAKTGTDGIATFTGLPMGDYYIKEKNAPEGYILDREVKEVSLIPTYVEEENGDRVQTLMATLQVENNRKREKITVKKTSKGTTNAVQGAVYGLYNSEKIGDINENTLLDVLKTNEKGEGTFEIDLPIGNYYVKEIDAPNGYLLSEQLYNINFSETNTFVVNVEDDYTKFKIIKTNEDGESLEGAELQLLDAGNNVIDEWISTGKEHEINGKLCVNEKYIIKELKAPEGYILADNIEFTVNNTAEIQTIKMIDVKIKEDKELEEPKEEPKEEQVTQIEEQVSSPQTGDYVIKIVYVMLISVVGLAVLKIIANKKDK